MARKMLISEATKCVRELARQDAAGEADGVDAPAREQIKAWRDSAGVAGDLLTVQAIDRLGIGRAAKVYEAARA